jgi:uncharacterized membrane protein
MKLKQYFFYFFCYSLIGWCYEVFLEVVVYRWGFSNRGVLFGPYCPLYGFGALVFIFCLQGLLRRPSGLTFRVLRVGIVFLVCMTAATAIELSASYILEALTGSWPWQTYADYTINFQARIALSPSVRFGLGGLFFLYVLQPLFEKAAHALPPRVFNRCFYILAGLMLADAIFTFVLRPLLG